MASSRPTLRETFRPSSHSGRPRNCPVVPNSSSKCTIPPNGAEQADRSSVGLVFAREHPRYEVRTRAIAQQLLVMPGRAANHEENAASVFHTDAEILSFLPHMHLRGRDFEYRAVFPGGKTETLLRVPRYEFNWQSNYRLAAPLKVPAGTRIECTAHYDNSAGNPNNPDPSKYVFRRIEPGKR